MMRVIKCVRMKIAEFITLRIRFDVKLTKAKKNHTRLILMAFKFEIRIDLSIF